MIKSIISCIIGEEDSFIASLEVVKYGNASLYSRRVS